MGVWEGSGRGSPHRKNELPLKMARKNGQARVLFVASAAEFCVRVPLECSYNSSGLQLRFDYWATLKNTVPARWALFQLSRLHMGRVWTFVEVSRHHVRDILLSAFVCF